MSLIDALFENKQRARHISQEHVFGRQRNHHDNHQDRYGEQDSHYCHSRDRDDFSQIRSLAQKLANSRTLLVLVGLVLVVVLGLFVAALVFVVPLIPKWFDYFDSNGLKSLLDQGMAILGKVLAVGGK